MTLFRDLCCAGPATLAILMGVVAHAAPPRSPFTTDPYPSTYRAPRSATMLIVGATILDGRGHRIENGDILIRNGKIAAVGHDLKARDAQVISARGRWVTPGLIDVHSHNGVYSTSDISEDSDPNSADIWIEHGVNVDDPAFGAAMRSGVTTLQVLPGSKPVFGGRSVVLKPVAASTVRDMKFPDASPSLKMACGDGPKRKDGAPSSRPGEVALVRGALLEAKDYLNDWREYERSGGRGKQPKRDLRLDALAGVLTGEIPVHMHCYRASDMSAMLGVAQEFGFKIRAFHHATGAYQIAEELRQAGTCVVVWSDWWSFKTEASDAIRENAAIVDAAGGCVMMLADLPYVGLRLNIEAAKAAAAGRRAGFKLPPEHIIRWITSAPAQVLGLENRIGAVAPGLNADLVIWSTDPFSIYSNADQVFIDGTLRYDRSKPDESITPDLYLGRPTAGSDMHVKGNM